MDDLLARALARRDALRKELSALENFIHSYSQVRSEDVQPNAGVQNELWPSRPSPRVERAAAVKRAIDEAERMILKENRPLTRTELVRRLIEAGHQLEGSDKSKVFGTNVWRSRRFFNIKGAGYWPKTAPIPDEFASFPRS
jgi:hypothetical protein